MIIEVNVYYYHFLTTHLQVLVSPTYMVVGRLELEMILVELKIISVSNFELF